MICEADSSGPLIRTSARLSTASQLISQDVIPYVVSDFLSWLLPSVLSPLCYVLLVYFIAGLRDDNLAANLFTMIASVSSLLDIDTLLRFSRIADGE